MSNIFAGMRQRLLDGPLGTDAQLNGVDIRIFDLSNVVMLGEFGQVVATRRMAEMSVDLGAAVGDTLAIGVQTFVLDKEHERDALFVTWILRAAA